MGKAKLVMVNFKYDQIGQAWSAWNFKVFIQHNYAKLSTVQFLCT